MYFLIINNLFISVGAECPGIHNVLQQPTQRAQTELAVSHVEGRARHPLLQESIHAAGDNLTYDILLILILFPESKCVQGVPFLQPIFRHGS